MGTIPVSISQAIFSTSVTLPVRPQNTPKNLRMISIVSLLFIRPPERFQNLSGLSKLSLNHIPYIKLSQ
jgi:hypothetical protein